MSTTTNSGLALVLREYPLIVSTFVFIYGVIMRDPIWLLAFGWSFLSMLANRGMKVLSMKVVERDPGLKWLLNRPLDDRPGMPSGHAQISAAFFVFVMTWLMYGPNPNHQYDLYILMIIALLGFTVMESRYLAGDGTKLQFVVGALIGGLFGLVPYYTVRLLATRSEWFAGWSSPESVLSMMFYVIIPALIFLFGSTFWDLFRDSSEGLEDDLKTELSE